MVERENLDQIVELLKSAIIAKESGHEAFTQEAGESPVDVLPDAITSLQEAGVENLTASDLEEALARVTSELNEAHSADLQALRDALENQPTQVVQQIIDNTKPADQVTVVNRFVTNVDEGDQTIDQSVNTTINAEGDVEFDQQVENTANQGDDGAVVVGGNLEDSAVNTGNLEGVQAAGDVKLEDSAIGDSNVLVSDSEVNALAVEGDALGVQSGGAANVGGTQVNTVAEGDVQTIVGDENDLTGDQTANINSAPVEDTSAAVVEEVPAQDSAGSTHDDLEQQVAQSMSDDVLEEMES